MRTIQVLSFLVVFFSVFLESNARNYHNYSLFDMFPEDDYQVDFLRTEQKNRHPDIIILNDPVKNEITQVLIHGDEGLGFLEKAKELQLKHKIMFDDIQNEFDLQIDPSRQRNNATVYEKISSIDDIYIWLQDMAKTHGNLTYMESIGKSAEQRDIYAFTVKLPSNPKYQSLRIILESGLHGNEWMGTNLALYMIDLLLNNGSVVGTKWKHFYWHFIPVGNPDGYEYARKFDRLWKKNRRNLDGNGIGVNLNRNFDYKFSHHDVDDDINADNYPGPHAFSEPETVALKEFLEKHNKGLTFYLSVHGHGEKLIIPFGDSKKHVTNYHEVMTHAVKAVGKTVPDNSRPYKVGSAHELFGKLYTGDSASWVKKRYHVPFVMTLQLRDNGEYGPALPTHHIVPACREMSDCIFALIESTKPLIHVQFSATSVNVASSFVFMIVMMCICL